MSIQTNIILLAGGAAGPGTAWLDSPPRADGIIRPVKKKNILAFISDCSQESWYRFLAAWGSTEKVIC
jgi:hypothetical protein